jgi:hypothetical protein
MNATDILMYGNRTLEHTLNEVPVSEWTRGGVCGWWSVKDIIAHLASYEVVLVDVLKGLLDGGPTPHLDEFRKLRMAFNDELVARSAGKSPTEVLANYRAAHEQVMGLIVQIPGEVLSRAGTLPWYGREYSLDDYLVYQYYGHKREHSSQVAVFKDVLKAEAASQEA